MKICKKCGSGLTPPMKDTADRPANKYEKLWWCKHCDKYLYRGKITSNPFNEPR